MRKIYLYILFFVGLFLQAQQGNVGINTTNPSATLDIVSKNNTSATKALKVNNSSAVEMLTVVNNGNVGINAPTPETNALLELKSETKALLLTRVPSVASVTNPVDGMILYDVSLKCIRAYEDGAWTACFSNPVVRASLTGLDCSSATHTGTLTAGSAASGVSSSIPYTGGNSGAYSGQTIASTGVTGLTATLASGNLASGNGSLVYTITGTPSGMGTASFSITVGGQTCTFTRTVAASVTIPSTITLAQNSLYMVASIYDQDYLPYTAPTGSATTNTPTAADGTNESTLIDVQGVIPSAGVTVRIPVTATGSGTLPAYSTTITVPANLTQDNTSRNLTLSWASQSYTSSTTSIVATITSVGGNLNAKKLDINSGVGNDALGVLLGQFVYPYNNAGNAATYQVRDIAGIPDRMFGVADNTGSTTSHMFLYLPVVAEDGNIWLNNNLGADYNNINKASFNPVQQATATNDFRAYGSLFQWGRKPDGHELINYSGSSSGTPVNNMTTSGLSDNPTHASFVTPGSSPFDWRNTANDSLWLAESSTNNPCPTGFRLPTYAEQGALFSAASITNNDSAVNSRLKLPSGGFRQFGGGEFNLMGSTGYYWTSTASNSTSKYRYFNASGVANGDYLRAYGLSVRCIRN